MINKTVVLLEELDYMNKVVIIGGDHHNALGIARVFGINGIKPYGILVSPSIRKKDNFAYLSKYWEKTWLVNDENEAIELLISEFSKEKEKPVIFPTSDRAGFLIDLRYNQLSQWFLLPNIRNKQGEIARLMDKKEQDLWAKSLGISTPKTWEFDFGEEINSICNKDFIFPCIVKPVISAEGNKLDIKKCENRDELISALGDLKGKGYKRTLIQEFIIKDYEAELIGCIPENSARIPYVFTKNVREWPPVGGTGSYHEFITNEELKIQAENILCKIQDYGYSGNIDIELFVVNGSLLLNEVNFRNSGDVYYCIYNKVFYPYYYYIDRIGGDISDMNFVYTNESWPMNEVTDFRYVVFGKIPLGRWLKDNSRSRDHALWLKGDIKPALKKYYLCFFKLFTKGKEQRIKANQK